MLDDYGEDGPTRPLFFDFQLKDHNGVIFHQLTHHHSQLLKNTVYLQLLHSLFRSLFGVMKDIHRPPQRNLKKTLQLFLDHYWFYLP